MNISEKIESMRIVNIELSHRYEDICRNIFNIKNSFWFYRTVSRSYILYHFKNHIKQSMTEYVPCELGVNFDTFEIVDYIKEDSILVLSLKNENELRKILIQHYKNKFSL